MKEITLTQNKVSIIDDEDYENLTKHTWHYNKGYACRTMTTDKKYTIFMHREIMNTPAGMDVDHINHNTLDNRKENLRNVTHFQNLKNQVRSSNNTSGYKGVHKLKQTGRWQAYIYCDYKKIHIGYFDDLEDAAKAYDLKAKNLFGEFAKTNF